jgi:DNA-binding MarR family transcriptional regulator
VQTDDVRQDALLLALRVYDQYVCSMRSQSEIADELQVSLSSVKRAVRRLKQLELLGAERVSALSPIGDPLPLIRSVQSQNASLVIIYRDTCAGSALITDYSGCEHWFEFRYPAKANRKIEVHEGSLWFQLPVSDTTSEQELILDLI